MTKRKGLLILFGGLFALLLVLGGTAAIVQAINLQDGPIRVAAALAYQGEGDADSPGHHGFGEGDAHSPDHHGFGEGDAHSPGHHGFGEGEAHSPGHHGSGEGYAHSPGHHGPGEGKHGFGEHFGEHLGEHLEGVTPMDELLAAELGVSVEALHDALAESHAAAQEQFEEGDHGFHGRHHGGHKDGLGEAFLALLAEKLGKPVDELQAAQAAAKAAFLAELVEAGIVTQEQIEMMEAKRALGETINPEALLAEALGMELAELEAAREAGASLRELLGDASVEEFTAAYKAAYEAAVLQAAADGVITDAQAEDILNGGSGFGRSRGFGKGGFFGPGHGSSHGDGNGHGHSYGRRHFGGPGGSRGLGPGHSSPQNSRPMVTLHIT